MKIAKNAFQEVLRRALDALLVSEVWWRKNTINIQLQPNRLEVIPPL